jgi:hypothetical protein
MDDSVAGLQARLKAMINALGKIMPTWQGQPIKAEDLAQACELLKSEGWTSPKWDPPEPSVWGRHYGHKPEASEPWMCDDCGGPVAGDGLICQSCEEAYLGPRDTKPEGD